MQELPRGKDPMAASLFHVQLRSGFFSTTLEVLLERPHVLHTANDAYMRDFEVAVPSDCVALATERQYRFALEHMTQRLKADTRKSDKVRFA